MRQIINLSLGECGIQLSNSLWQLFLLQHSINPDGTLIPANHYYPTNLPSPKIFSSAQQKQIPRVLFINNSSNQLNVINQLKTNTFKDLYNNHNFVTTKENKGNSNDLNIVEEIMDKVRKLVQDCQDFQGFLATQDVAALSSHVGKELQERLSSQYQKKISMGFTVYPQLKKKNTTNVIETYNSLLASHNLLEHSDINFMIERKAVQKICTKCLLVNNPTSKSINQIISQVISSVTSQIRLQGYKNRLNSSLSQILENNIILPRLSFLLSSFAPFGSRQCCYNDIDSTSKLTQSIFWNSNQMIDLKPTGKYSAVSIMYRGDVSAKQVNQAVKELKLRKTVQFLDWIPQGFRLGINQILPRVVYWGDMAKSIRSALMIANTTSIKQSFDKITQAYDSIQAQQNNKQFLLNLNIQEQQLIDARQDLAYLETDFYQIQHADSTDDEEQTE